MTIHKLFLEEIDKKLSGGENIWANDVSFCGCPHAEEQANQ